MTYYLRFIQVSTHGRCIISFLLLVLCLLTVVTSCTTKEEPTALNVKTKEFTFTDAGGMQSLSFVANKSWRIDAPDSWCSVSQISGNTSESEVIAVEITCKANDTYAKRESTITVICAELSEFITVKQDANYSLQVSPLSFDVPYSGQSIEIEVQNNDDSSISVSSQEAWIKKTGTKGLSNTKYTFSIERNDGYEGRVGTIRFSDDKHGLSTVVTISQGQKDIINVTTKEYHAKPEGDEINLQVSHNIEYSVNSSVDWIYKVDTKAYVTDNLTLKVNSNETGAARSGVITIASTDNSVKHEITVYQEKRVYPVESITLDRATIEGLVGDEYTLLATVLPENATDKTVTWTSNSDDIASVDSNGKVILNQVGECTITATAGKFSAKCEIKIVGYKNSVDLSANGTANCYIVPEVGVYRFKATKGNTNSTVAGVKAEILWRSFNDKTKPSTNDIINGPLFKDGYIFFATTKEFKEGNAVIALKAQDGTIVWSWHLWVTAADIEGLKQTYANNAGIMMDRNLGALSAKSGDPLSFGLLYEWGRKDPFTGCASYESIDPIVTDAEWPAAITTRAINERNQTALDYSISNPMQYIYNSEVTYDWQGLTKEECNNYLWNSNKTQYDPCPVGWRVPDGGDNGLWMKAGIPEGSLYNSAAKGIWLVSPYCSPDAWYPSIGGGRQWNGGYIMHVGEWGNYWSCTYMYESWMDYYPQANNSYYTFDFYASATRAKSHSYSGQGHAVRCCKE